MRKREIQERRKQGGSQRPTNRLSTHQSNDHELDGNRKIPEAQCICDHRHGCGCAHASGGFPALWAGSFISSPVSVKTPHEPKISENSTCPNR